MGTALKRQSINPLFFQSNFRFTAKLKGKQRFLIFSLPPHMHSLPHYQHLNIPHHNGMFATLDQLTRTHHYQPESTVHVRVCSSIGLNKGLMICTHCYGITESSFTALHNPLCSFYSFSQPLLRGFKSGSETEKWGLGGLIFKSGMPRGPRREATALLTGHPSNPSMRGLTPPDVPEPSSLFPPSLFHFPSSSKELGFSLQSSCEYPQALSDSPLYDNALISIDENRNRRCAGRLYS